MIVLKNFGMLIVIAVLGLYLFDKHTTGSVNLRDWMPGEREPSRGNVVEELRARLEGLYQRVSSPLVEGAFVDPAEIETWKDRCRSGYEKGTYSQEQATAAWRLCRTLEGMLQERERLSASMAPASAAEAWTRYVEEQRPRCEHYLRALH